MKNTKNKYLNLSKPSKSFFSSVPDYAVPGSVKVSPWAEKEVILWGTNAPPVGSVLRSCTSLTALHHRDESEEHFIAGEEQGRRDYLCNGAWVRKTEISQARWCTLL